MKKIGLQNMKREELWNVKQIQEILRNLLNYFMFCSQSNQSAKHALKSTVWVSWIALLLLFYYFRNEYHLLIPEEEEDHLMKYT